MALENWLPVGLREKTRLTYMDWWRDFKRWFDGNVKPDASPEIIVEIAKADEKRMAKILLRYRDDVVKGGLPEEVADRIIIAIRSFFNANGCALPLWWDGKHLKTSRE
jgi:hypothetical protein